MASSSSSGPSCRDMDNTVRAGMGLCRGGFDFSLLFEETILEILPISILILVVPFRIWQLSQKRRKVVDSWLLLFKLVSISFLPEIVPLVVVQRWPFGGRKVDLCCFYDRLLGSFCSDFKSHRLPSGLYLAPIEQTPQLPPVLC